MRIAVLMACYNRVNLTVRFLEQLDLVRDSLNCVITVFLLDDDSQDGTAAAVAARFPDVVLVRGNGTLFWNGGMCAAYREAKQTSSFDAYLLANDDVDLFVGKAVDFFRQYHRYHSAGSPVCMVGETISGVSGEVTYGGFDRGSRWKATEFNRSQAPGADVDFACETFNANFVLVPGRGFEELGGLDPNYRHGFGDLDLGLSLGAMGYQSMVYREPIGVCEKGPSVSDRLAVLSRRKRAVALFTGPHGLGPYAHFVRKNSPAFCVPLFLVQSIVKRLIQITSASRDPSSFGNQGAKL